jgi:hypothetical protein
MRVKGLGNSSVKAGVLKKADKKWLLKPNYFS